MAVLSEQAETALRRLGALDAFFREMGRIKDQPAGRVHALSRLHRLDDHVATTLREVVIVRAVSIVEAFVLEAAQNQLASRLASVHPPEETDRLISHLAAHRWQPLEASGAWTRLIEFCRDGLGLAAAEFPRWHDLVVVREARHAIIHRVGEMTPKYVSAAKSTGRLRRFGVEPSRARGNVLLDEATVRADVQVCRAFVLWFDSQLKPIAQQ